MEIKKLQERLSSYKAGTFIKIKWQKDIASAKALKDNIHVMKECEGLVRLGVSYKNLRAVRKKISDVHSNKPSWFKPSEFCIVEHKEDATKKYLQVFTVPTKRIHSSIRSEKPLCELVESGIVNKSALAHSKEVSTFLVDLDSIVALG